MAVESMMFFALGFLAAVLFAIVVVPSIWRRAVRLTKRRIEAATPMTMAEFRADKDQLRAQFALSTRSLEKNIEVLRDRLAGQLGDLSRHRTDMAAAQVERDQHKQIAEELIAREAGANQRIHDLEREFADVAQKLRMADRELVERATEIEALHNNPLLSAGYEGNANGDELTGAYEEDVGGLLKALALERERTQHLEARAHTLLHELEDAEEQSVAARAAIAEMRDALARTENEKIATVTELRDAEERIASAETRLNALLNEAPVVESQDEPNAGRSLAEMLSLEEKLEDLQSKITRIESTIANDWDRQRGTPGPLRDLLIEIASDVSVIVYSSEADVVRDGAESLFDRVQKFAGDGIGAETLPIASSGRQQAGSGTQGLSGRMAAVRNIQAR